MKKEFKKKKDSKTSSSILVGALVCFVLIAVYGIVTQMNVSYAFPETLTEIKNVKEVRPKLKDYTDLKNVDSTWDKPNSKIVGSVILEGKTTADYIIDVFCLERDKIMPDDVLPNTEKKITYKKSSDQSLIDEGINYIVLQAYDKNITETENEGVKTISLSDDDYYDAQMALWIYQNNAKSDDKKIADITNTWTSINNNHGSGHAANIYNYIKGAEEALENKDVKNNIVLEGKVEFKLTTDEKYYETGELKLNITKAPNTEFTGFNLKLDNDKNVEIVIIDNEGNVVETKDYSSKIVSGQKFKFRIKKDDLPSNTTVSITGKIEGKFNHMGFEAYEAWVEDETEPSEELQIVLIPITKSEPKSVEISASVTVPDTGAGYSGYVYIVGALVLIVGLTIIYVNTKVKED